MPVLSSIGAGIGHAVGRGITCTRGPVRTPAEEGRHHTRLGVRLQMGARRIIEEPLHLVVLVVLPRVVLGSHLRVAQRDLPQHDPQSRRRARMH